MREDKFMSQGLHFGRLLENQYSEVFPSVEKRAVSIFIVEVKIHSPKFGNYPL
jgi:hypothetical protein